MPPLSCDGQARSKPARPNRSNQAARLGPGLGHVGAVELGAEHRVVDGPSPRQQEVLLRHVGGRARAGRRTSTPSIDAAPALGASSPASTRRSVLFPQPLGPTRLTNSPRRNVEVDAAEQRRPCGRPRTGARRPASDRDGPVAHDAPRSRRQERLVNAAVDVERACRSARPRARKATKRVHTAGPAATPRRPGRRRSGSRGSSRCARTSFGSSSGDGVHQRVGRCGGIAHGRLVAPRGRRP